MKSGIDLIKEERERQIISEGYTALHDDQFTKFQLGKAALVYLTLCFNKTFYMNFKEVYWPYGWRYKPKDHISNLVRAGALIAAEIDRLQRLKE